MDSDVIIKIEGVEYKFKLKSSSILYLEKKLGKKVITSNNKLNYKYKDDYKMVDNK